MSEDRVSGVPSANARRAQMQKLQQLQKAQNILARQMLAKRTMIENAESALFNAMYMLKDAESLEKRRKHELREKHSATAQADEDTDTPHIEATAKIAENFANKNDELKKQALLGLRVAISSEDSPEEVLAKVLKSYPDKYLADEAFDFLETSTDPTSKMGQAIRRARILLNERFGREVRAGRNMNVEAQEFSKQGMGTATSLRGLYQDITGNPREPLTLFEELIENFSFDRMKTVLQFILHSIGSDLKAKGPSISRFELQRLLTDARSMQAILGVYRFFFSRMSLIQRQFDQEDLAYPKRITFELLAKLFVKMLAERYPSIDKVLRLATSLGISDELIAQMIVFSQYRDAIRSVSPKLFKSDRHRQDLLNTLIETLSEIDDLLDEEEEEDEDDDKPVNEVNNE